MASNDNLKVTANFEGGLQDTLILTASTNTHVDVNFVPGDDYDVANLVLSDVLGLETPLTIDFVDTCVPDNPFYIRWINRFGGWEYYMFSAGKRTGMEVKEADSYAPYSGALTDAYRTREVLALDRTDIAEVGEEQLSPEMYALLASIAVSPRIDAFNPALGRWEGITIEGKHTLWWNTRNSRGAVGYTFRLIDQNNQF